MSLKRLAGTAVVAAFFLLSGAESAACVNTVMDVASTAAAETLVEALNCTGGGEFNVTWHGRVRIDRTFEVAGGISLNVTGNYYSSLSIDDDVRTATILGDDTTSQTGLFVVSGASSLTLKRLVLQGGQSKTPHGAGAVEAQGTGDGTQTVNVIDCQFRNNTGTIAGAIYAVNSAVVNICGETNFIGNAGGWSGAILTTNSAVNIYGASDFLCNAGNRSGAIFADYSEIHLYSANTLGHSTAEVGGSACFPTGSNTAGGGASFKNNTSTFGDGGAINAFSSDIFMEDAVFIGNSAPFNGGAIYVGDSSISITGATTFTNNVASHSGGGLYSIECGNVLITGNASLIGNSASVDGGAMLISTPGELHIDSATFERNKALSGGAVALFATAPATYLDLIVTLCTFEANYATNGGALYLFNSAHGVSVAKSVFLENVAASGGGAILLKGGLRLRNTRFEANQAHVEGMAVASLGDLYGAKNVTFEGNYRYCPAGQYSYDEDLDSDDRDTCRAEVVCTGCSKGCEDIPDGLSFSPSTTVPVSDCKDIPKGAVPSSAGMTLATLELERGFYRTSSESHEVLECHRKDSCIGGLNASNYCAAGYEGPYCAVCAEDYVPGIKYSCHKCSERSPGSDVGPMLTTLLVFVAILVVVLSYLLAVVKVDSRAERYQNEAQGSWEWAASSTYKFLLKMFPLTSIKVVLVVWQILTQFADVAGAVYPDAYESFLSKLDPINVDIGFMLSYSCIAETNFYHKLLLTTMMPFVLFAMLGVSYAFAKKRNGTSEAAIRAVQNKHRSVALFVTFFVYSPVSFKVFQTFVYDSLDDGVDYLRADYSLSCSSTKHSRYVAYASVMVLVYPIGIPAAYTLWLARHRHDLTEPGRETVARLQSLSGLWAPYRPSHFYYEVVECGRRVCLTGVAVFVFPGSAAQIAVVLLVAVVFSLVSESMQPFQDNIEMWLYRWGNGVVLTSMYVALLRKVDVSGDDSPTQSAFSGVFIAANVLMIVAVLVQSALYLSKWR